MNRRLQQVATLLFCLGFLGWCVYFVAQTEDPQALMASIAWVHIGSTAALHLLFFVVNGLYLLRIMKKLGVHLRFAEAMHISFLTTGLNAFLPLTAGMVFRAFYLKKYHALRYSEFIAVSAGTYLLNYYVVFLAGLVSAFYVYLNFGTGILAMTLFSLAILAFTVFIFGSHLIPSFRSPRLNRLNLVLQSWQKLAGDRGLIADLSLLSLANLLITSVQVFVAYKAVGVAVDLKATFFLTSLESLNLFVKLTPGNLGVNEALLAYGGNLIEVPVSRSLLASAVRRVSSYGVLLVLMPLSTLGLFGEGWRSALQSGLAWLKKSKG